MRKKDKVEDESRIVCRFRGSKGYELEKGHIYLISIYKTIYGYQVEVIEDLTKGESCNMSIPFSSRISIDANWIKVEN